MPTKAEPLRVTEEQVSFFRARRSHLAGPGAADVVEAARAILGAQSQQIPPSLHALSLRTKGRPTAAEVERQIYEKPRALVRTWGQRGTVHVYDAKSDWARIVVARHQWTGGSRRGPMPDDSLVDEAKKVSDAAEDGITRKDLIGVASRSYVDAVSELAPRARMTPALFAATRLVWGLSMRGDLCFGPKIGAEQTYVARRVWHRQLRWPARPESASTANARLADRYLQTWGPATVHDLAHFLGARVSTAREWIEALRKRIELVDVHCGDREGLLLRAEDVGGLRNKPPTGATAWPLRLLPLWDCMLMAHADKRWTVPEPAEEKLIWRKAALVAPVVVDRGRFVATWNSTKRRDRLEVRVQPHSLWRPSKHLAGVKREATAVAAHLGLGRAEVVVGKS